MTKLICKHANDVWYVGKKETMRGTISTICLSIEGKDFIITAEMKTNETLDF